jgi:hypothetical protein
VVASPVSLWQITYGFIGAFLTLGATYYSYHILLHFREHEDVSMEMLFLKDETADSFQYLVFTAIAYAVISVSVFLGLLPDNWVYDLGVLGLFAGNLYFLRVLGSVTDTY